jgi:hypothetical protein
MKKTNNDSLQNPNIPDGENLIFKSNVIIIYFVNLRPKMWSHIVIEQLNDLKSTELYEISTKIYVSVISSRKQDYEKFSELIKKNYSKIEIINHFTENLYEYPGIKALYDVANSVDDETLLLYFHSKGMFNDAPRHRKKLFDINIRNYSKYIYEFEKNSKLDVAGCSPGKNGFVYYNFFWVKSSYIKNHVKEPQITDNRFYWEVWLADQKKTKKVITFSPFLGYNPEKGPHDGIDIFDFS